MSELTQHHDIPRDGERVLFCEHADVDEFHVCLTGAFHWYYFEAQVTRCSDGENVPTRWIAICEQCQAGMPGTSEARYQRFEDIIAQDAPWIGEPPQIDLYV